MHIASCVGELAGDNDSIAPVIAFTSEDADPSTCGIMLFYRSDDGTPSRFHKNDTGNANTLNSVLIDLAHFRRSHDFHVFRPCAKRETTEFLTATLTFSSTSLRCRLAAVIFHAVSCCSLSASTNKCASICGIACSRVSCTIWIS